MILFLKKNLVYVCVWVTKWVKVKPNKPVLNIKSQFNSIIFNFAQNVPFDIGRSSLYLRQVSVINSSLGEIIEKTCWRTRNSEVHIWVILA